MLHMQFVMDNFNVEKLPTEEESPSSCSSSSSDDDIMFPIVGALLHYQQQVQNKWCSFYNISKEQKSWRHQHLGLG